MRIGVLLVVVAASASGCSLLGARRPDPPPYSEAPKCSPAAWRPVGDTFAAVGGVALAGLAGVMLATTGGKNSDGTSNVAAVGTLIAGGIGVAGVFGTSAAIGYPRVGACRDAWAEWDLGAADRATAAAAAEAARDQQRRLAAAELLRCPTEQVHLDQIGFDADDPLRTDWSWVGSEAEGCGRAVWCGESEGRFWCKTTEDYEVAAAQLAIETQCARANMVAEQRQVFTKRSWDRNRREVRGQVTWRINACGAPYVCSVTAGLAAGVQCKAALSAQPPAPDQP